MSDDRRHQKSLAREKDKHTRVFISYSHDSPHQRERVLAFALALISDGIDVELDQFHEHEIIDWPRWCNEQISEESCDFVICICTQEYCRRIEGKVPSERGKGVYWEGALLDDEQYDQKGSRRILPVLFGADPVESIPRFLRGWTFCRLDNFARSDEGYVRVLRILTRQARIHKHPIGLPPVLPTSPAAAQAQLISKVSFDLGAVYESDSSGSEADIRFTVSNNTHSSIKITGIQLQVRKAIPTDQTMSKVPASPLSDRSLFAKISAQVKSIDLLPSHHILKPGEVDAFKLIIVADEGYRYDIVLLVLWHTLNSDSKNDEKLTSDSILLNFPIHSPRGLLTLSARQRGVI